MLIEKLNFRGHVTLICLAIKLLFTSIQQYENGPEKEAQERESVKKHALRQLLENLGSKIKQVFYNQKQEDYHAESLLKELEVRFQFV